MHSIESVPDEDILQVGDQPMDRHYVSLYRFALRLARNSFDADDLTQQTFLIWSTKGQTLRDKSKVRGWLFTTLYRLFLHGRRKAMRLVALEDLPHGEQEISDVGVDMETKIDAQLVLRILQEVDLAYREPLTLFYLQELSYRETARTLDLPVGTVMSRLHRGKIQLRALLSRKSTFPKAA